MTPTGRASRSPPEASAQLTTHGWRKTMTINDFQNQNTSVTDTAQVGASGASVTERLERELLALDALGFKSQPWKSDSETASAIAASTIDIDWLVAQRELPYLVQTLPPHLLYRSLMNHGIEDSLEVLEWVRGEALVRVLDYDLWVTAQSGGNVLAESEQPSGERFIQWIRWWNEVSPEFAAQRVVEFDEGLIIGCMTAACEIIPVGLHRSQEELADDYWVTPDNRFGLKMKTMDEGDFEVFHQFVHSLYKQDIRLAQTILAHSAMLVREESVEEARRWRAARLEEQGFLSADEARHLLNPKSNKQLTDVIRTAVKTEPLRYSARPLEFASESAVPLRSDADEELRERLVEFVQKRDVDELAAEIEKTLGTGEIVRFIGTSAPQSEMLVQDEDVIDAFVDKVTKQTAQILLSLEAQKMRDFRAAVQRSNDVFLFDATMAWLSEHQLEKIVDYKTRIARTTNAVAAALGVSNEPSELSRVLVAVHGCLNVGLERLTRDPDRFLLGEELGTVNAQFALPEIAKSSAILTAVGPEAVFQVGWQTLQELASDALQMLVYTVDNNDKLKSKIGSDYVIQLSDGQAVRLSVLQLHSRGRYLEVRKWLSDLEPFFDISVHHILKSTLNRLPVFPILMSEGNSGTRGTTAVKPYERLEEVEKVRVFVGRLPQMVSFTGQGE